MYPFDSCKSYPEVKRRVNLVVSRAVPGKMSSVEEGIKNPTRGANAAEMLGVHGSAPPPEEAEGQSPAGQEMPSMKGMRGSPEGSDEELAAAAEGKGMADATVTDTSGRMSPEEPDVDKEEIRGATPGRKRTRASSEGRRARGTVENKEGDAPGKGERIHGGSVRTAAEGVEGSEGRGSCGSGGTRQSRGRRVQGAGKPKKGGGGCGGEHAGKARGTRSNPEGRGGDKGAAVRPREAAPPASWAVSVNKPRLGASAESGGKGGGEAGGRNGRC